MLSCVIIKQMNYKNVYFFAAVLGCIACTLGFLALFSWTRRKKSPAALSFAGLLFCLVIYAAGYAVELLSPTLEKMLFWNRIEYLGISFIPTFWILFTAQYANIRWKGNILALLILIFVPITTLFGASTDLFLHLRYATVWVSREGPFPLLAFTRGPLYWTHTFYSLFSLVFGTVLFSRIMLSASRFFRPQQLLMLAGTVFPWINYVLYLSGINIWGIDTIPFSMFFSAVFFSISIFSFKILDVLPVARGIVFETISDGVIVLDYYSRIVDFNPAAAAIFPELEASSFSNAAQKVLAGYDELCRHVADMDEGEFLLTNGIGELLRYYLCKLSIIPGRDKVPIGAIILVKDNTNSTLLLGKLQELATIDPLTRLFNRRHFIELTSKQIIQHARTTRPLSLVMLDLDHFKRVNDMYGHLVGDIVLHSIASTLSSELRGCDIAARFGGEEFICLLPETGGKEAFIVTERMRHAIRKKCIAIPAVADISISASFGICSVGNLNDEEKLENLLAHADTALYRAKENGRNRTVLYDPNMEEATHSVR